MDFNELKKEYPHLNNQEILVRFKDRYSIKKSIQRLGWRLSSDNSFKPNEKDVDSLNTIINWVNRQQDKAIENNHLFAKLYIYFLHQNLNSYKCSVFEQIPHHDLNKKLDTDLKYFYDAFHKDLHTNQIESCIEKGSDLTKFKDEYSLEFVTDKLNETILEALNRFSK